MPARYSPSSIPSAHPIPATPVAPLRRQQSPFRSHSEHRLSPLRALRCISFALLTLGVCISPASIVSAESGVMLKIPSIMENIGATTFDADGQAVGKSRLEIERRQDGSKTIRISMNIAGGGSNISQATLSPVSAELQGETADALVGDGARVTTPARPDSDASVPRPNVQVFRVTEERSQSRSAEGRTFPLLVIDHEQKRVSCYPEGESDPEMHAQHVSIPDGDRVVNVPMQLLFQPLVEGEVDSVRFKIATCADGPVLHEMIAVRAGTTLRNGRRIVEIEYGPDFGETVAWLASRLLPSFSFWFDAQDGSYLGHRMPLHRKGPEITLVRQGLTPVQLGIE